MLQFATVPTTPYHPAPGLLHLHAIPLTWLASLSLHLRSRGFTTANSLSKIFEEFGLSLSSFMTLGKLLLLSTPERFFVLFCCFLPASWG